MPVYPVNISIAKAFFGLGYWELIIILLIILVVFGAGKLPGVGSALGEGIRNFRTSFKGEDKAKEEQAEKSAKELEAPKTSTSEITSEKKDEKTNA